MLNAFHSLGDRLEYLPDCQTDDCDAAALWIDLMTPTRAEELHVEQVIGAELPTRAEMEEIEPSSRLSAANDVLYLTAALPCRAGGNDPAITVVTFVLTEAHLVTVRYDEPGTIPLAIKNVTTPGANVTSSHGALLTILEAAIDRLADVIEQSGARIETISRMVFEDESRGSQSPTYKNSLRRIGREGVRLGHFQESLISLSRLLLFLTAKMDGPRYDKDDVARLKPMKSDVQALADAVRIGQQLVEHRGLPAAGLHGFPGVNQQLEQAVMGSRLAAHRRQADDAVVVDMLGQRFAASNPGAGLVGQLHIRRCLGRPAVAG